MIAHGRSDVERQKQPQPLLAISGARNLTESGTPLRSCHAGLGADVPRRGGNAAPFPLGAPFERGRGPGAYLRLIAAAIATAKVTPAYPVYPDNTRMSAVTRQMPTVTIHAMRLSWDTSPYCRGCG